MKTYNDGLEDAAKLEPCPFCGDEHFSTMDMTYMHDGAPTKGKRIKCGTCGAQAPDTVWNTRALKQPEAQQVESVDELKLLGYLWILEDGSSSFMKAPIDPEDGFYSEPLRYKEFHKVYAKPKAIDAAMTAKGES